MNMKDLKTPLAGNIHSLHASHVPAAAGFAQARRICRRFAVTVSPFHRLQRTSQMLWNLIVAVIVGFIVGLIARALMPGNQSMGFFATALLGMAGSVLASYGGGALGLYPAGSRMGWGASIIGALIALFIYNQIAKKQ